MRTGSQSPITLLELGLYAGSDKLRVICTEEFYRYDNVRITCARYGVPLFATLQEAIEDIVKSRDFVGLRPPTSLPLAAGFAKATK